MGDTSILSITGDKAIVDLNVIFAFNYLSLQQELNLEKQKQNKYGKFRK